MDNEDAFVDNVFCTAILQILEIPGILTGINIWNAQTLWSIFQWANFFCSDSSTIDLDELKYEFERNGCCDESFYGNDHHPHDEVDKRKPLANLQSKMNKHLSKKALKLAKAQKSSVSYCKM